MSQVAAHPEWHVKRRAQLSLPTELIIDNFAGGGGASTGIEMALGRSPDIAVNHDREAVRLHKVNHPRTHHLCEDVFDVDPKAVCQGRRVALAWFSPDCTFFSKARGAKPFRDRDRARKRRGLAGVVIRWAKAVRPRVIMLENVEEWLDWGPLAPDGLPDPLKRGFSFRRWRSQLERAGYVVELRQLRACDYGAPTTRKRLFVIARSDGQPIVWPEPTHGPGRAVPYRTAAECIDWSIPCPSIFERKKPLAEKTMARIARGIRRFVLDSPNPFIVPLTRWGDGDRARGMGDLFPTVTTAHRGEIALVEPFLARTDQHKSHASCVYPATDPLRTVTTGGSHAVVAPTLVRTAHGDVDRKGKKRGKGDPHIVEPLPTVCASLDYGLVAPTLVQTGHGERKGQKPRSLDLHSPLGTVVAGGQKHALVSAHLSKLYGTSTGASMHEPAPTVTATGGHLAEVRAFLTKFYGQGTGQGLDDPLGTAPTHDRFGLVTIHGELYAIADIGMRMLQPRELFRAQGFPDSYVIDRDVDGTMLTKTAQVRLCGNSVCPPIAAALVAANVAREEVAVA